LARLAAALFLCTLLGAGLLAGWIAPNGYSAQFRDAAAAAPSWRFPFGTDDLGRDLLARALFGLRLSLLLAGTAALGAVGLGAVIGMAAGYLGGFAEWLVETVSNLLMGLPWVFLMLAVRAALPLDLAPEQSAWVTFLLLGLLGWAPASRVFAASARQMRHSAFALRARAEGISPCALLLRHLLPNARGLFWAQFLVLLPGFMIAEATLSFLGLGVSEPLPSMGGLLRDLEDYSAVSEQPWRLAPLGLMFLTVLCLQALTPKETRS
jgi:ABC-type dipeptide/oligopeptide/nickel transport system permease subunit